MWHRSDVAPIRTVSEVSWDKPPGKLFCETDDEDVTAEDLFFFGHYLPSTGTSAGRHENCGLIPPPIYYNSSFDDEVHESGLKACDSLRLAGNDEDTDRPVPCSTSNSSFQLLSPARKRLPAMPVIVDGDGLDGADDNGKKEDDSPVPRTTSVPSWGLSPAHERMPMHEQMPTIVHTRIALKALHLGSSPPRASFELTIKMKWTDPRLRNYPRGKVPPNMWCPFPVMKDTPNLECKVMGLGRGLSDIGDLMEATALYTGTLSNAMDISNFPFDFDDLTFEFQFRRDRSEKWQTKQDMRICFQKFVITEDRVKTEMQDWSLVSATVTFDDERRYDCVRLSIFVMRSQTHAFIKLIAPLLLFNAVGSLVFLIPEDDLADQLAIASGMMVAISAFLASIAAELPKTSYASALDQVILFSIAFMFAQAFHVGMLAKTKDDDEDHSSGISAFAHISIYASVYIVFLSCVLGPKWWRQQKWHSEHKRVDIESVEYKGITHKSPTFRLHRRNSMAVSLQDRNEKIMDCPDTAFIQTLSKSNPFTPRGSVSSANS